MSATSAAPVARLFASSAIATLPPDRRSPMMPEPTTVARSSPVPKPSASSRLARLMGFLADAKGSTRTADGRCSTDGRTGGSFKSSFKAAILSSAWAHIEYRKKS